MNKTNRRQSPPYEAMRSYLASKQGKDGLERLEALGGSWGRTEAPFLIVPQLARMRAAPPLPDLHTHGNAAAFLVGVCWCLTWTSQLARHMED